MGLSGISGAPAFEAGRRRDERAACMMECARPPLGLAGRVSEVCENCFS